VARTKDDRIKVLSKVPLFAGCSDKELRAIASKTTEMSFPKGAVLTKEGAPGEEAFVIAEGHVDVSIGGKQVATLGPGEILGEMSLLDHGPRAATARAATDVTTFVLNPLEFETILGDAAPVTRKILKSLAERLRAAEQAPHV
jgi:CRP/FNR family transcriptional regulator, cyclic AMP receptor protein